MLTYNTWLVAVPLQGQRHVFAGYLSELAASDQPQHWFFRAGDVLTGLVAVVLAVHVLRTQKVAPAGPRRGRWPARWRTVVVVGLLVFAGSTLLDAVFALDCAPTHDTACRRAEDLGQLSVGHHLHEVTSVAAQLGATGSLVAGVLALASGRSVAGSRTRPHRFVVVLAATHVLALAVMLAMLATHPPGLGYPQAAMVVTASVWFALIGLGVLDH